MAMTTDDTDRPDPGAPDEQQEGQVSETATPEPEAGGADATDKSTGTAPDEPGQPA